MFSSTWGSESRPIYGRAVMRSLAEKPEMCIVQGDVNNAFGSVSRRAVEVALGNLDPAVLKTLRDSELLRCSVFTTPPYLLRCEPVFEGKNACKTQENSVSTGGSP